MENLNSYESGIIKFELKIIYVSLCQSYCIVVLLNDFSPKCYSYNELWFEKTCGLKRPKIENAILQMQNGWNQ